MSGRPAPPSLPIPGPSEAELCAVRLRRAVLLLARRLRPALLSNGLSTAKLSVVGQLHRAGPMTPTELAAREGVKLASLTRLVAELDEDGWVGRAPDAADGRRSILSLTPLGKSRLIASANAADGSLAAAVAAVVAPADLPLLQQACGLLERIIDSLGGASEAAASPASEAGLAGSSQARRRKP